MTYLIFLALRTRLDFGAATSGSSDLFALMPATLADRRVETSALSF